MTKSFVKMSLGFCLAFPPSVFAKGEEMVSPSQVIAVKDIMPTLRKLRTVNNSLQVFDALAPEANIGQWMDFFKKKKIDTRKITYDDVVIEGNKVFFAKVKEPFVVSNSGSEVSYKGVSVVFKMKETPEKNWQRVEKAWGGFRELGLRQEKKTAWLWKALVPAAYGGIGQFDGQALYGVAAVALLVSIVKILGASSMSVLLAYFAATGTLAIAGVLLFTLSYVDKKIQKVPPIKNAKLACTDSMKPVIYDDSKDNGMDPYDYFKMNDLFSSKEAIEFKQALEKLCRSPQANEFIEKFNAASTAVKRRALEGELDPISEPAPLKKNLNFLIEAGQG